MVTRRLLDRNGSTLVIIDVQSKLMPFIAESETVIKNIVKLIRFAKVCGIPIILTEQYPKGLGGTINDIAGEVPGITPIEKTSFSCFGSEGFNRALKRSKTSTLILVGIEAHVCVFQTALEAIDDYRVCVISDAVSSRTLANLKIGLQRMRENGVTISSTEMLMYELLKDAKTKEFKELHPLLR